MIRATADGIVSPFNLRNPGQTVQPGQNIAQIVPSNQEETVLIALRGTERTSVNPNREQ